MSSRVLASKAAALIGGELTGVRALAGGDLSPVIRIELADDRVAVVKGGPSPRDEASMLDAIRGTGAPAPAVLACDDSILVLEYLANSGSIGDAWRDLGTALAMLHRATNDRYGWDCDYAFAGVAIGNAWSDSWPSFWAERRLRNHAPHIARPLARRIEQLADDLGNRLPDRPKAALLHGDLWSGNVLADGARISGLIDPAAYFGHRDVDFAMLRLFGRPGPELFDAYGALEPGHEERLPIYQLWPALVHLRLFGSGYASMVERLLSRAGV